MYLFNLLPFQSGCCHYLVADPVSTNCERYECPPPTARMTMLTPGVCVELKSTPARFYRHIRNAISCNPTVFFLQLDPTYAIPTNNQQASAIQNREIQYNSDARNFSTTK
jgi:hypothetical protein